MCGSGGDSERREGMRQSVKRRPQLFTVTNQYRGEVGLDAAEYDNKNPKRGILLVCIALALFYSHVFPFGIFGLGFAAMFPWTRPREWIRAGLPIFGTIPSAKSTASPALLSWESAFWAISFG